MSRGGTGDGVDERWRRENKGDKDKEKREERKMQGHTSQTIQ